VLPQSTVGGLSSSLFDKKLISGLEPTRISDAEFASHIATLFMLTSPTIDDGSTACWPVETLHGWWTSEMPELMAQSESQTIPRKRVQSDSQQLMTEAPVRPDEVEITSMHPDASAAFAKLRAIVRAARME
jgi:hypothetical protein